MSPKVKCRYGTIPVVPSVESMASWSVLIEWVAAIAGRSRRAKYLYILLGREEEEWKRKSGRDKGPLVNGSETVNTVRRTCKWGVSDTEPSVARADA